MIYFFYIITIISISFSQNLITQISNIDLITAEIEALKNKLDLQADTMIKQGLVVADPVEYRQELIKNLLM